MCTLIVAWRVFSEAPVCVGANRDEAYDRPATPPGVRGTNPRVLAPRDERAGGTWLGYNEHGVLVAVTNRWVAGSGERSRGLLVDDALREPSAQVALERVEAELDAREYGPFYLVAVDEDDCFVVENGPPADGSPSDERDGDGERRRGERAGSDREGVDRRSRDGRDGSSERRRGGGRPDGRGDGRPDGRNGGSRSDAPWRDGYRVHELEPGVHVVVNVGFDGDWFVPPERPEVGREQAADAERVREELRPRGDDTAAEWTSRVGELLGDHDYGVCVHGDGFGTRSSSLIRLGDERYFAFADGPPCENPYEVVDADV